MPTRTRRTTWTPAKDGLYTRQIGWRRSASGKRNQAKFRLGKNVAEAKRRLGLIQRVWERQEAAHGEQAEWDELSLRIAKSIARGDDSCTLPRLTNEDQIAYARRVNLAIRNFPMINLRAEDEEFYTAGANIDRAHADLTLHATELNHRSTVERKLKHLESRGTIEADATSPPTLNEGPTLHESLNAFIKWIRKEYQNQGELSDNGRIKIKRVNTFIERHEDVSLAAVDYGAIESMLRYWRLRPNRKGTDRQISPHSAKHFIGECKRFFRWLNTANEFQWSLPSGFDSISTKISGDKNAQQSRLFQVETFSLKDLRLLYQFASPLDRTFLLLGLNCGFGAAEISSLQADEVHFRVAHSEDEQQTLGYQSTATDSWIKRIRRKNRVYGEFLLFPETVKTLQWALSRRQELQKQGLIESGTSALLTNDKGHRFDKLTSGGNPNRQIANRFSRLKNKIKAAGQAVSNLSFGKLRKTAGNLIRKHSDGETSSVFLCHGKPVATDNLLDVYTNRPFANVFNAIRKVETELKPAFDVAAQKPAPEEPPQPGLCSEITSQ